MELPLFVSGCLLLLGIVYGFSVISNRLSAREEHRKAKVFTIIGILFGFVLLLFVLYYLPIVTIRFCFADIAVISVGVLVGLIEAMIASHFDLH